MGLFRRDERKQPVGDALEFRRDSVADCAENWLEALVRNTGRLPTGEEVHTAVQLAGMLELDSDRISRAYAPIGHGPADEP